MLALWTKTESRKEGEMKTVGRERKCEIINLAVDLLSVKVLIENLGGK